MPNSFVFPPGLLNALPGARGHDEQLTACFMRWRTAMETKKVLVVEDNPDWRQLLMKIVQRAGYDVVIATTGIEAVEKASTEQPDLIFMDIGLPLMNGDEATAVIKANAATKDIPVIIQTAYGFSSFAERAVNAGAAEVLQKPFPMAEVMRVLRQYLSPKWTSSASPPTAVRPAPHDPKSQTPSSRGNEPFALNHQ